MSDKPTRPSGAVPASLEVSEHILRQAIDNSTTWTDEERIDHHYALSILIAEARLRGRH